MSQAIESLFSSGRIKAINVGTDMFGESLRAQGAEVVQVAWRPPGGGDVEAAQILDRMAEPSIRERIDAANARGVAILASAQPTWTDVLPAAQFVPGFKPNWILHTGPPVLDLAKCPQPFKNAMGGAAVVEGLARGVDEAWAMILSGELELQSQLDHRGASGAVNAVTASTPVQICTNPEAGTQAFCTFNEGPSMNALRWGVFNEEVKDRLTWFREFFGPAMATVIRTAGGFNLRNILSRTTAMGDENHSRQIASTALLLQQLIPAVMDTELAEREKKEVIKFLCSAERFFLHVFIAGAACVMEGLKGIDYCTIQVGQGGNGQDFGTKFSFSGNDWYRGPGPVCKGMYLKPGWDERVALPYMGDSCVVETYGFGGPAAAAGPMVTQLTGGGTEEALRRTEEARAICLSSHEWAAMPLAGFRGPAVGFDLRLIVETGITPIIHGGMHHVDGGQAGAGSTNVPMICYTQAVKAFAKKYGI